MSQNIKTDILIIGTGIAGLSLARNIVQNKVSKKITIISKTSLEECNTNYAQGGIAVVYDFIKDSFEQHINDTLKAGQGINNKTVVEHVIKNAPNRLKELLDWGVELDKNKSGSLDLGLEGGHSQNRIVHHKDKTGQEIESKLISGVLQFPTISILSSFFVLDLIVEQNKCYGIIGFNNKNETVIIQANEIILATGGSGQVFSVTSNPTVSTGDGVAMALRSGVVTENMKFIQFHPTALYEPNKPNAFLISEAVRGFGAYVVNQEGKRFLFDYTSKGELATRDVVSAAITSQIKKEKATNMWLDLRHLNQEKELQQKFTKIYSYCTNNGYNLAHDLLPIIPAAHYQCGGIKVDNFGKTNIKNLYAIGECSSTGLHGANRLASNSLLEALVYAYDLSQFILNKKEENNTQNSKTDLFVQFETIPTESITAFKNKIRNCMNYDTLHTKQSGLESYNKIQSLKREFFATFTDYRTNSFLCETYNLLVVAECILVDLLKNDNQNEVVC